MSAGGLLQLVAIDIGGLNNNELLYNNNAMDIITYECAEPIRFDRTNSFIIVRSCDVIKSIYFTFKMAPLPPGWIYKNKWLNEAFERIELVIGGYSSVKYVKETERMLNLILQSNSTLNKHLMFDYTLEERRVKSLQPHEVTFEFNIKDTFSTGLPLVTLTYNEVRVNFTLGYFTNCIECDEGGVAPNTPWHMITPAANYLIDCKAQIVGLQLQPNPRTLLVETPQYINSIQHQMASINVDSTETHFNVQQMGRCSAMHIHITNTDGSEIERPVLDSLRVVMNGIDRFNISGFQSRHLMPSFLPYQTRDNTESQNLYCISYHSETYGGRVSDLEIPRFRENSLNHSRIDAEQLIFTYNGSSTLPSRIKITIMHRVQNEFRIFNGTAQGFRYDYREPSISVRQEPVHRVVQPLQQFIPTVINAFQPDNDMDIFIPPDAMCVITLVQIGENADIVRCEQCHNSCLMEAMNEWFKVSKTCPHCRASSRDYAMYICGKSKGNAPLEPHTTF
jgi:hypothetical protein